MKLSDSIKMSINDLKNRKIRTFLTCFSIGIGVMLIVIMGGLGKGLEKWANDSINSISDLKLVSVSPIDTKKRTQLIKEKKFNLDSAFKKIDKNTINTIKNMNGVNSIKVSASTKITGTSIEDKTGKPVDINAVDTNYSIFLPSEISDIKNNKKYSDKVTDPIVEGNILEKNSTDSILIGERYLKKMGITDYSNVIGKNISLKVELPNQEPLVVNAKISGIINKLYTSGNSIIVPINLYDKIQEFLTGESNYSDKKGPSKLIVETNSMEDSKSVYKSISKLNYSASTDISRIEMMQDQTKILSVLSIIGGIVVLLVSSIGVINTMTMSVFEKTKSIGIMKAVGASKQNIKSFFIVQSATLGFSGGILGIVMAFTTSSIVNTVALNILSKKGTTDIENLFITPISLIVGAILLATLVSIIAGIIPASKASKLEAVESLSYE